MKNARRTFVIAGLVAPVAAAVAWCRFAPGEAPTGQPPLVTIDAEALDGLRTDFNRHGKHGAEDLVFLTRGRCANTTLMRRNLDEALPSLRRAFRYEVVDQDTLAESDVRRGYPTPTLLYANRDVFGMPVPTPPLPEPT